MIPFTLAALLMLAALPVQAADKEEPTDSTTAQVIPPAPRPVVPAVEPDPAMRAFREGRYEEAASLLESSMAEAPTYDGLVALGIAQGRTGRRPEARATLDRAIEMDPHRA